MTTPANANLAITQGTPFAEYYRFTNANSLWPNAVGCEARSQMKEPPGDGPVVFDFTPYLSTPALVTEGDGAGTDIIVVLSMTGQQTREVPVGPGYVYDLFLSDTGDIDARAMRVGGRVSVTRAYTSASANV